MLQSSRIKMQVSWFVGCLALVLFCTVDVWCMESDIQKDKPTGTKAGDEQSYPDNTKLGVDPLQQIADAYAEHLYRVFDAAYGQVRRSFGQVMRDIQRQCTCSPSTPAEVFVPPSSRAPPPKSAQPVYTAENPRPVVNNNNASPPL